MKNYLKKEIPENIYLKIDIFHSNNMKVILTKKRKNEKKNKTLIF